MRTKFLLICTLALVLVSCDKIFPTGEIWDISPVVFTIQVADANGVDLLNPENHNSLDTSEISALYRGEEYKCSKDPYGVFTKAYAPHFYGLQFINNTQEGKYALRFGELDGAESYSNEEITISWGDGSSDKIKFNRKFRWRFNGDPVSSEEWFLNGTKVSGRTIKIVK